MNKAMKIALLGKGKTGGKVLELLLESRIQHTVFDSGNPPTKENLINHDIIISFLPGEAFKNYISLIVETKIPVICGSTGIKFSENFNAELIANNVTWIYATNFSLGMNLVYEMIKVMSNASKIFPSLTYSLHEIHHTKKLDSPSGTALSWMSWLNHDVTITSERIGDVPGIHELSLLTSSEKISIRHEALDRKIFAEGALYAAKKLFTDKTLLPGLHLFQNIVLDDLHKKEKKNDGDK